MKLKLGFQRLHSSNLDEYQMGSSQRNIKYLGISHIFILSSDGSKCSSWPSIACIFINSTLSFQLHISCSIFTAEITAILHALSEISSSPPDNYIIYSDPLSAVESMTSLHRFSHPLAFNILELDDRLTSRVLSFLFCWIPSHVGNELAEDIAKSATISLNSPVPVNDVKKYIFNLSSTQNGKLNGIIKTQINSIQLNV
ncbi:hypothetical protein AVEN_233378-1 [Araneus ventricosus]|uniref:Uncharacterized protein n=1 Tax=Araneus ventricosus TaxID=182803 RepID=A0A4Y2UQP3_ARAVE|nr:hypothetical protein AVEN_233378-1 [Araneus ventricosus]